MNKINDYLYQTNSSELFDLCKSLSGVKNKHFECNNVNDRFTFSSSFSYGIDFIIQKRLDFLTKEVEYIFIDVQTKRHMPHKGCTPLQAVQLLTKLTK